MSTASSHPRSLLSGRGLRRRPGVRIIAAALMVLVAAAVGGCGARMPVASEAFAYACQAGGECAVYLTLTNSTGEADALVAARTDLASHAELHTLVPDENGGMKMQQVARFPVSASGAFALKPATRHIMLHGVSRELQAGDTVPLTLLYENGGENTVQVRVRMRN